MTGTVLEFTGVTLDARSPHVAHVQDVTFRLAHGEIVLILAEEGAESLPLADLAQGLIEPTSGDVRFCGELWSIMGPRYAAAQRGNTRRVFESEGWVQNLSVMDNLILAGLHHTDRSADELADEAEGWARHFGLPAVPATRPALVGGVVLRKLEWVRALMGQPALIIIERRQLGVPRDDLNVIVATLGAAAGRGTAVLWVTADSCLWGHAGLASAARYRLRDAIFEHAYEV